MKHYFYSLPIGKKLQLITLAITSLVTLVTTGCLSVFLCQLAFTDYRHDAQIMASVMAENIEPAILFHDIKAARESLNSLKQAHDVSLSAIFDSSGTLFAAYTRDNDTDQPAPHFSATDYLTEIKFGIPHFDSVLPLTSTSGNHEALGTLVLRVDLRDAYKQLSLQIGALLLAGLISFTLIAALLTKLQKHIARPLIELADTMRKVTQNTDFSIRADMISRDEIGELAKVFNTMLDELSQRDSSLKNELQERRHVEMKLSELVNIDPVTKLPNRNAYNNQINKLLLDYKQEQEKFALMFLDLDNFKYVNDTFGHQAGDLLLAQTAERLRHSLRHEDFLARLGGDEFVILMNHYNDQSQISTVAEKILKAMSEPFLIDDREAFVGASIGITLCPDNGVSHEILQSQADNAMYHAKHLGKNNFQYYQGEHAPDHQHRIALEGQLRHAMERNELIVHYQPVVEISNGHILGFEALVRWIKQDGTLIGPDEFIPLAEEIGLIGGIGDHVMNTAAKQMSEWNKQFGTTFIAINFSSKQFKRKHFTQEVLDALDNSGLQSWEFEMEITESVLMDNAADNKATLSALYQRGIIITIDDFGTGYSSLSYLTHFPVKKLKIDRSFVSKLPHDSNAFAVVSAIISLAKSLNMKVVAEGIETVEQEACLTKMGCTYGQGYLYSKAVTAAEATKLLALRNSQSGRV